MKIGVIADDFTGASDIALMLAEGGMPTEQFVGIPTGPTDAEAAVISLKCRSIPAADAIKQSRAAARWLMAQGAVQIIFKICSTFDSTDQGNIGPVTEALAADLGESHVIVCPAFPAYGRAVFQGHLFVNDGLLSESGMQDHPLTPMTDADLRRVLAAQSAGPVHHVAADIVWQGADALETAIGDLPPGQIIVDAIRDEDLRVIGAASQGRKLLTGGSGIALGLPSVYGFARAAIPWDREAGPAAILLGSCSRATRGQVAAFNGPKIEVTAADILNGTWTPDAAADWAQAQDAPAFLIYSSADPAEVAAAQIAHGLDRTAQAVEGFYAATALALVANGARKLVLAGGETSGAVVEALQPRGFNIGPRLAAGVPALRALDSGLALALKSGNFGGPDFFNEAAKRF